MQRANRVPRGIISFGVYIPRLRLQRAAIAQAGAWANPALKGWAKGSRSMKNWDEDSVTMALEAARNCMGNRAADQLQSLSLVTTTAPFQDRSSAGIVASALDCLPSTLTIDQGSCQSAATTALLQSLDSSEKQSLITSADSRPAKPGSVQQAAYGDGAAAVLIGEGEDVVAEVVAGASVSEDFVDHIHSSGQPYEIHWEERWVRDEGINQLVARAAQSALGQSSIKPADINYFVFDSPLKRAAKSVAHKVGFDAVLADSLMDAVGYLGCAHPLLQLAHVLERAKPGELILLSSFGSGSDAIIFRVTEALTQSAKRRNVSDYLAQGVEESNYNKYLSFTRGVELDWGIRGEAEVPTALTQQYRVGRDMAAFRAGQCVACGTIQFPRSQVCVNPACDQMADQRAVSLADEKAKIISMTADWLSFKECPPFAFGLVQFENGARVLMEFADCDERNLKIGAEVEMAYRRKEVDSGRKYHSYFWKAVPVAS